MESTWQQKFRVLFIDYNTDYCISHLVKQKDNLEDKGLALFKKIRAMRIQVKMLQSDNAGENKALQKALEDEEFNINFQYTAAGTPQQNGKVEQKIVTLYGKKILTINLARMSKGLHGLSMHLMSPTCKISSFKKQTGNVHAKKSTTSHHILC